MIYIAAPFFNSEQIEVVENIKKILEEVDLKYFSPKDECMFKPGETTPKCVLDINTKALESTTLLVAVTDGKDPGTLFECGYSYAREVPILYVWLSHQAGQKFNLMLAASGDVALSYHSLEKKLRMFKDTGSVQIHNDGGLEYE